MLLSISTRRRRALAVLPLLVVLTAARTSVGPLPETMAPIEGEQEIGKTFTAKKGDIILRAKVLDTEVVTIDAPVSVGIAKFTHDIEPGTKLDPVLAPAKTSNLTGADGRIYCGENQRTRSKFAEAMIGDLFSKFEAVVRFCFIDTDNDKKLDKVFLAGAKDKEHQSAVDIEPTPYSTLMFQDDDEEKELQLSVHKFKKRSNKVQLMLTMTKGGEPFYFDYIMTIDGGEVDKQYPRLESNPKKVPYPAYFNDILGAAVGIMRVDAEKEEVDLQINRPFEMQLFKPVSIQVNYVYIYY